MKKTLLRIAAGAGLLAGMTSPVLAHDSSIHLTGPDSRNIIESNNSSRTNVTTQNWVTAVNANHQFARSGDVDAKRNTFVDGTGGSGDAWNENSASNSVSIENEGGWNDSSWGGGSQDASIHLTGPDSNNRITFNNSNRFTSTTRNNVAVANVNNQVATSGDVSAYRNTSVDGVGGSGNAYNSNSANNDVSITNSTPASSGWNGTDRSASISTTGPDSNNQIRFNDSSTTNVTTTNNVSAVNYSNQVAHTGDVNVSGNTYVSGSGGSGDAANFNNAENTVDISNQ
jgi:hypothetical protein